VFFCFVEKTPFLLRIHNIYSKVNPVQAKINCARLFKEKSHLRDPTIIDHHIAKGYDALSEAEQHYCQNTHLYQFFCPRVCFFSQKTKKIKNFKGFHSFI